MRSPSAPLQDSARLRTAIRMWQKALRQGAGERLIQLTFLFEVTETGPALGRSMSELIFPNKYGMV